MSTDYQDFDAEFDRLWPVAMRVAAKYTGDRASAEDVAAEAMARACAEWRSIGRQPWLEAWVVRVTARVALGGLRRPALLFSAARAADEQDRATDSVVLFDALRRLPKRQREAVVLCHYEGFTEAEAAAVLGISPNTVKTHSQRGIAALRGHLARPEKEYLWTR